MNESRKLHKFYNPTLNDMKYYYCDFICGARNECDHPEFFKYAWDNFEKKDMIKWFQVKKKKISNIVNRRVWQEIKSRENQSDRRLIKEDGYSESKITEYFEQC